jgi:hypothetical protein
VAGHRFKTPAMSVLVTICKKQYQTIENKIAHDRDRKAFTKEVLDSLIKLVFRNFSNNDLKKLLSVVQDWWQKGDPTLAAIAESRRYGGRTYSSSMFPENYYAAESYLHGVDCLESVRLRDIVEEFKKQNYFRCPRYMSYFGMKTPDDEFRRRQQEKQKKINKIYSRKPTPNENLGINLLARFIRDLSPEISLRFENARYTIGESEEILGELRSKRGWHEQHVFLEKSVFILPFDEALAILIHEWSHIFGSDGSRYFSDALTNFIALILKNGELLGRLNIYKSEWTELVETINQDRKNAEEPSGLKDIIGGLSREAMRTLLLGIPEDSLFKLLDENKMI